MTTKSKQRELKVKRPKPNLHGPSSPTPIDKFVEGIIQEQEDEHDTQDKPFRKKLTIESKSNV